MAKRAIVTGGAGFIGSHVVDALLRDDYAVTVVDNLYSGDAARVAPEAELRELDIVSQLMLKQLAFPHERLRLRRVRPNPWVRNLFFDVSQFFLQASRVKDTPAGR